MIIRELSNDEFTRFINNFENSIYQTKEYAFVMNKQKFDSIFVGMINDDNNIVAATLLLTEQNSTFKYAYAPRGFLIDYRDYNLLETFTKLLKNFLNKKNVIAVKLCPQVAKYIHNVNKKITIKNNYCDEILENLKKLNYFHMGYNNYFEALKPRFEAILNLKESRLNLFKNMSRRYKTKIRSAERNGIQVYRGTEAELPTLYAQTKEKYPRNLKYFEDSYNAFKRENKIDFFYTKLDTEKYLTITKSEFEKQEILCDRLNEKILKHSNNNLISKKIHYDKMLSIRKTKLIEATNYLRDKPNGIITSTILVVKNKKEIFMLIDGHDKKYRSLNSKHLLIWKLIEKYSKEGFETFNFGGASNPNLKDNKYQGLNDFKVNFNSNIFEYIGDYELVINQTKYFMYKNSEPFRNILKR